MRHDWILDVLADLRSYALQNDLSLLAAKVEETLHIARAELAHADPGNEDDGPAGSVPPGGRAH